MRASRPSRSNWSRAPHPWRARAASRPWSRSLSSASPTSVSCRPPRAPAEQAPAHPSSSPIDLVSGDSRSSDPLEHSAPRGRPPSPPVALGDQLLAPVERVQVEHARTRHALDPTSAVRAPSRPPSTARREEPVGRPRCAAGRARGPSGHHAARSTGRALLTRSRSSPSESRSPRNRFAPLGTPREAHRRAELDPRAVRADLGAAPRHSAAPRTPPPGRRPAGAEHAEERPAGSRTRSAPRSRGSHRSRTAVALRPRGRPSTPPKARGPRRPAPEPLERASIVAVGTDLLGWAISMRVVVAVTRSTSTPAARGARAAGGPLRARHARSGALGAPRGRSSSAVRSQPLEARRRSGRS